MATVLNESDGTIFVGGAGQDYQVPQSLLLKYANRHGMIAGATGYGQDRHLADACRKLVAGGGAGLPVRCQR